MCNMKPDHQCSCIFSTALEKKPQCIRSGSGSLTPGALALSKAIEGGKRVSPKTHQDHLLSRQNQERINKMCNRWAGRFLFLLGRGQLYF